MSIAELKPDVFLDEHRAYADLVKPWQMYVQGVALRECAVWIDVGGVKTMIGFGDPDSAMAEAEAAIRAQIAEVRRQLEDRKQCGRSAKINDLTPGDEK